MYKKENNLYIPQSIKSQKNLNKEVGKVGTGIFSGYIDVDYSTKWQNLSDRIELINEMKGGDATIEQILDAKKAPLLSAKFFLKPSDDSSEAIKIKDFIQENLFERINFQAHLVEVLTYFDYGFSVFAKNYSVEDGKTFWKSFKFMEQSTIQEWNIEQKDWINGHPVGITQLTNSPDEETDKKMSKSNSVDWTRILRFSNKQKGNNYEGVSVLRSAYIHWYFKNLFYKLSGIFGDRYGAGMPVMEFKQGTNEADKAKFIELVKNVRSNEQSYAVYEEGNIFKIITPDGSDAQDFMMDFIKHQDKKIYDSVSAGFLNLTTGDGGSNALSKDQSSFFTRSLQSDADYILSIYNYAIKELLYLNVIPLELAPTLCVSDIGQISTDEYIEALSKAKHFKLVTWTEQDEEKVRAQLKLDPLPADVESDYDISSGNLKSDDISLNKKKIFLRKIRVSSREKIFLKNISDYENFLESCYFDIDKIFTNYELKYKKGLESIYNASDTFLEDGIEKFANTSKNRILEKKALKFINAVTKKLNDKVIKSPIERRLFETTKRMAILNITENEKQLKLETAVIDQSKFRSFEAGYISNVEGILFNEPRRIKEEVMLNYGSKVGKNLTLEQVSKIKFNRNTVKLSFLSHPRGAYNAILFDENTKKGFSFFKLVAPKSKIKTLSPSGVTAGLLFIIATASVINKKANEKTDGKNTSAIDGLNVHHNSFIYYFAVSSIILPEEEELAKQQREELKLQLSE